MGNPTNSKPESKSARPYIQSPEGRVRLFGLIPVSQEFYWSFVDGFGVFLTIVLVLGYLFTAGGVQP